MHFLLLGLDSLIACAAICLLVDPRSRLRLAALFGVADGVTFLIGAGLGWHLWGVASETLGIAILVALGLYLIVVAAGVRRVAASWPIWVVPVALTLDNLAFGLAGDATGGSLPGEAAVQALSSSLLALAGLLVAVVLPRVVPAFERRDVATRVSGGALVLAAGGLALLG